MVEDLRERIDRAAERFAKSKRVLLRDDGKAKYAPVEFQELEQVAKDEFFASLDRVEDEIDGRISRAEQRLQVEENRDPSSTLTSAELEEANARRAFISDEVFSLGPEALERRTRAVIAAGDRVGAYLYSHFIRSMVRDSEYGDSPAAEANRLALEGLVKELSATLDPDLAGRIEAAKEEIAELQKIRDYAYLRKNGAKDPVELHLNKTYGATKW